jgi:hypothetical protein
MKGPIKKKRVNAVKNGSKRKGTKIEATTGGEPLEFVIQQTEFDAFFFALHESDDPILLYKMFVRAFCLLKPERKRNDVKFYYVFQNKNSQVLGVSELELNKKLIWVLEENEDYESASFFNDNLDVLK